MTPLTITAKDLFEKLRDEEKLEGRPGVILFTLSSTAIHVKSKAPIGGIIQEWVGKWLDDHGYSYAKRGNTQDHPDYYLDPSNRKTGLLEIKAFDSERSANFDIANFDAYARSLLTASYRLDADYLIFGYKSHGGQIVIHKMWLKKVWEIAGPCEEYPIKVQRKQNVIYNIRPITWYSTRTDIYRPFGDRASFVKAFSDTLLAYHPGARYEDWLENVKEDYLKHTGHDVG